MPFLSMIQSNRRLGVILLLIATTYSIGIVTCDSWGRYRRILTSMDGTMGIATPIVDPTSWTGYEKGMRKVILPQVGVDGCHWIMHTQKLLADGGWRIRFTDIDNYPIGREIHWSHGFIWWLIFLGRIHSMVTGLPLPASVEAVAPYANTLLLVMMIVGFPWVTFRRFGAIAASGLAMGFSSIYVFYEFFMVGNPDHHGIAAASAVMCALLLAVGGAGWIKNERLGPHVKVSKASKGQALEYLVEAASARHFFVGSALAGSVSLWVSAATAVPTFIGIGIGVLVSVLVYGRSQLSDEICYHPELWRRWGIAGCCGSIFFYLLEYFPSHMGMRLEVNHPLYALAWLGGGEILCRIARWRVDGVKPWSGKWSIPIVIGAIVLLLMLPALIALFPERFFWVADHFLWNFHKDYIHEFKTFVAWLRGRTTIQTLLNFSAFLLLSVTIVRLLVMPELGRSWKGVLALILLPASLLTCLGFLQVRWLGIANALWISTIPVCLGCIFSRGLPYRFALWEKVVGFCFAGLIFFAFPIQVVIGTVNGFMGPTTIGSEEAFGIYIRDLSYSLRRANPDRDMVVVSGPTTTTYMMYYGGMRGIGTLYWENVPGLKATAEIYAARSEDEAFELVKQRKVSHIAIFKSDAFAFEYTRLLRGLEFGAEASDAFIPSMITNLASPRWLKPIHFRPPVQLTGEWLVLLEVKPDQTIAEARMGLAEFLEARGEIVAASNELVEAIKLAPENRDAWFRLGTLKLLYEGADKARDILKNGLKDRTPDEVKVLCNQMAMKFYDLSRHVESAFFFRESLETNPNQTETQNALAWLLATSFDNAVRNPTEALALAQANTEHPNKAIYLDTLAAAQAANGDTDAAAATVKQALEMLTALPPAPENPDPKVLAEHLRHYESGLSFRTGGPK